MARCNCFGTSSGGATASLVNDPVAGVFTFNNGAGEIVNVDYCSNCAGGSGSSDEITEVDGVLTHTAVNGAQVSWSTVDRESVTFASFENETVPAISGLWIEDREVTIDSFAITAGVAPTSGAEDFVVRHLNSAGTQLDSRSMSLATSVRTTGVVVMTPITVQVGELIEVEVTTGNGSERLTLHLFYTENDV